MIEIRRRLNQEETPLNSGQFNNFMIINRRINDNNGNDIYDRPSLVNYEPNIIKRFSNTNNIQ